MKQKSSSLQNGFTLLEGILALSLLMGLLALGGRHQLQRLEKQLQQGVSEHHCLVMKAAEQYVFDDYGGLGLDQERKKWQQQQAEKYQEAKDLQATLSLEQWRYQQLRERYLPEYLHEKNSYQQQYAIYITAKLSTDQPHYQLLVTTHGGLSIKEPLLRQIARELGNPGGYISHIEKDENQEICITGNQKQWQMSRPSMTLYQPPKEKQKSNKSDKPTSYYETPGHLVSLSLLYDRDIIRSDNLLHRKKIANKSQVNTMETDLEMRQNQLIFENNHHIGTMNAQELKLMHHSNTSKIPSKLSITSEKIQFSEHKPPEEWSEIVNYSPAELHTYWNKIPYYELAKSNDASTSSLQLAGKICQRDIDKDNTLQSVGRIFMIGFSNSPEYAVYLCADSSYTDNHSSTDTNFLIIHAKSPRQSDDPNQSSLKRRLIHVAQGVSDFIKNPINRRNDDSSKQE